MSYCLNPTCQQPQNSDRVNFCQSCGKNLLLVNQYRAIRLLGQGGFGRTLLAVDRLKSVGHRCVIKQFYPTEVFPGEHRAARRAIELFEQEAQQLEQLGQHAQIPKLLAHFEQDDRQYIVQEYIAGENLAQELQHDGLFSETELRKILNDLLPVLRFIHQHQVIHRDIKPENIIRRQTDRSLVLVDFGAAKLASHANMGKTATMIGSAGFAAPEQLRGKPVFASDLYSLGVTCIYLLTHTDPFDLFNPIEGTLLWREHLTETSISNELGLILDKLIQASVKQRYQSAEAVLHDLRSTVPTYSLSLLPPETTQHPVSLPSRKLIASDASSLTLQGHQGKVYSIAFSPDSQLLVSGSGDETVKLWNPVTGKVLHTQSGGWWSGHRNLIHAVAFSPNGQTFASASWDKTVKLWDIHTGQRLHALSEYPHVSNAIAFSPNGSLIASGGSSRRIKLWETDTGQRIRLFLGHTRLIHTIAFHPNGHILASGSSDQTVRLWDIPTGKVLRILKGHTSSVISVAFSPDGKTIASGGWDNVIKLWDVQTGEPLYTFIEFAGSPHFLCFSPDGKTLANTSANHTLRLWDLETRRERYTLHGHTHWINAIAYSPSGESIASGSNDGTIKIWQCD
jgi:serine/threonine protein kinase